MAPTLTSALQYQRSVRGLNNGFFGTKQWWEKFEPNVSLGEFVGMGW